MPEPIDRHALLKKVYEHTQERERMTDGEWCRKCIYEAPKVEAEPVRHGRWETWGYVFHGIEWKRCSRCGKCADVSYYGLLDGEIKMSTPAICGGCGARMDATETNVGGKRC